MVCQYNDRDLIDVAKRIDSVRVKSQENENSWLGSLNSFIVGNMLLGGSLLVKGLEVGFGYMGYESVGEIFNDISNFGFLAGGIFAITGFAGLVYGSLKNNQLEKDIISAQEEYNSLKRIVDFSQNRFPERDYFFRRRINISRL